MKKSVLISFFVFIFSLNSWSDLSEMINNLNRHAGNIRGLGSQTLTPGQPRPPALSSALQLIQNPAVVSEIQRLEGRLHQATRVLANPNSSPQAQRLAAERIARSGPNLIRLMEARAGLVRALNQSLRTSVAQANGVRPYVSNQGGWLNTTLRIVREMRSQLNTVRPQNSTSSMTQSLARGIRSAFQANMYQIRTYFVAPPARGRGVPSDTPDFVVDPDGNVFIER